MAKESLVALGVGLAGGALGIDYFVNGPDSVIGKLLGKKRGFSVPNLHQGVPSDPLYGENRYGQTSVGNRFPGWVYPIQTARAPFPALLPDTSGRVKIPVADHMVPRREAEEIAAQSVANLIFADASFYSPTEKWDVGTTEHLRHNILHLIRSPDSPELLRRLVEFHHKHGPEAMDKGSPLHNQQIKLAGACADLYEDYIGMEKWFSREGNAYAAEYDKLDDRLAAAGAKSPITFNIGGAYWNQ